MPASPTPPFDDDRVYLKTDVMERLRCSERHVDRLIDSGALKPVGRRGRGVTVRITARSLREYIYGGVQ